MCYMATVDKDIACNVVPQAQRPHRKSSPKGLLRFLKSAYVSHARVEVTSCACRMSDGLTHWSGGWSVQVIGTFYSHSGAWPGMYFRQRPCR